MGFKVKIPNELHVGPDHLIDLPQGYKAEVYIRSKEADGEYIVLVKDPEGLPAEVDHIMNPTGMDTKLGIRLCLEEWARSIEQGRVENHKQGQASGLTEVPPDLGHKHPS